MTTPQSHIGRSCEFDARGVGQLFRRRGSLLRSTVSAPLLQCVLFCAVGMAQQDTQAPLGVGAPTAHPSPHGEQQDTMGAHMEHQMADRRNEERQRQLVADTDKLLDLAQALKAEVDKSNKDQLSLDVVKRAEQIEKLAKSVKEKMKGY